MTGGLRAAVALGAACLFSSAWQTIDCAGPFAACHSSPHLLQRRPAPAAAGERAVHVAAERGARRAPRWRPPVHSRCACCGRPPRARLTDPNAQAGSACLPRLCPSASNAFRRAQPPAVRCRRHAHSARTGTPSLCSSGHPSCVWADGDSAVQAEVPRGGVVRYASQLSPARIITLV